MVQAVRVGHVVLNVRDLGESERFYTQIVGFQVALKGLEAVVFTCGTTPHALALYQAPQDAPPVREGQLGLNHFSFEVEDLEALKSVYRRLKEYRVRIDRAVDHGITGSLYFYDPDGNLVEFYYDKWATHEEGLALLRSPHRQDLELVLEDLPTP